MVKENIDLNPFLEPGAIVFNQRCIIFDVGQIQF